MLSQTSFICSGNTFTSDGSALNVYNLIGKTSASSKREMGACLQITSHQITLLRMLLTALLMSGLQEQFRRLPISPPPVISIHVLTQSWKQHTKETRIKAGSSAAYNERMKDGAMAKQQLLLPMSESLVISAISKSLVLLRFSVFTDEMYSYWEPEGACAYMSRLPGADIDLSSLLLGHSKGLLKDRFLSMALTKIWNIHRHRTAAMTCQSSLWLCTK